MHDAWDIGPEGGIARGVTRLVWIFASFVVKWPRLWCGISQGMKANRNERNRWRWYKGTLPMCPIWFADAFGFVVIMPRAKAIRPDELWPVADTGYFEGLPLDVTTDNVGKLNGEFVMFDYGALGHPPERPAFNGG